jgi:hypothetical protein
MLPYIFRLAGRSLVLVFLSLPPLSPSAFCLAVLNAVGLSSISHGAFMYESRQFERQTLAKSQKRLCGCAFPLINLASSPLHRL